ncbi:MAG: mycothiol system anti-sigma-R factor [Micrococcales bacterium]
MTEFDCQETKRHVQDYLQAELSEQEMDEITAHLANCDSCESDYDLEQVLNKVIQRSCTEATPEELGDRILAKIRGKLAGLEAGEDWH